MRASLQTRLQENGLFADTCPNCQGLWPHRRHTFQLGPSLRAGLREANHRISAAAGDSAAPRRHNPGSNLASPVSAPPVLFGGPCPTSSRSRARNPVNISDTCLKLMPCLGHVTGPPIANQANSGYPGCSRNLGHPSKASSFRGQSREQPSPIRGFDRPQGHRPAFASLTPPDLAGGRHRTYNFDRVPCKRKQGRTPDGSSPDPYLPFAIRGFSQLRCRPGRVFRRFVFCKLCDTRTCAGSWTFFATAETTAASLWSWQITATACATTR